jgi:hypothetical protein
MENPEPVKLTARCAEPDHTAHEYTADEAVRLIEALSVTDWEDGPHCCREILDGVNMVYGPFDPDVYFDKRGRFIDG